MTKAMGFATKLIGASILFAALRTTMMAQQLCDIHHASTVPEIDATLGGSVLALLSGAMLIVR